uniref:Uncharacterized protein n=1 Tax=Solanum tuberosum TaxID=4113 RepID=M1DY91_SOLTU
MVGIHGLSFNRWSIGTMASKQAPVYSRNGKLKFVSPSKHLINESNEDEYVSKTTRDSPIVFVTMRNRTSSNSNGDSNSASDATSTGDAQDPLGVKVESVYPTTKPNRWCVEGKYQIYDDEKTLTEHRKVARTITKERRVLTGSLHTVPAIEEMFKRHKYDWMAWSRGNFSEPEFYASYAAIIHNTMPKLAKPLA